VLLLIVGETEMVGAVGSVADDCGEKLEETGNFGGSRDPEVKLTGFGLGSLAGMG